jgi:glycosyltransferase involved in cell wall biosynthesis
VNILNLLNYSPDFGGGIAKHLLALGKIAKLNGHKLYIGFPKKKDWQNELELNSQVIIIPEIENALWSRYRRIIRDICRTYSIDIIHIHFDFSQTFSLSLSIKKWNIPTIYQWHNPPIPLNELLTPQNELRGKIKKFYSGLVARFTDYRTISHHITISNEIKNLLDNNGWVKKWKITLLPNGVSPVMFNGINPIPKTKNVPIIGSVANFRPEKDHFTLLQAFSILLKRGLNSELWLVGEGPTRPYIKKIAEELGIESKLRFIGTVSNPDEFYQQFDIFVLSTHYEGQGLVILEAMSFGLPVVATRISGVPEVVTDGVNGLLVNHKDPDDLALALQKILTNKSLYVQLSEAAFKSSKEKQTVDGWAKSVLSLYENVLLKGKKS